MEKQQKIDDGFSILIVLISCVAHEDDILNVCFLKFPQLFIIDI